MQTHTPTKITCFAFTAVACLVAVPTSASAQIYPGVKCVVDGEKQCKVRHAAKWHQGEIFFSSRSAKESFVAKAASPRQNKHQCASLILKANHQLALTGQYAQHQCPITGKRYSKTFQLPVAGLKIYLHDSTSKAQLRSIDSTLEKAKVVFAASEFTKTFSPARKKTAATTQFAPGANRPVSIANSKRPPAVIDTKK